MARLRGAVLTDRDRMLLECIGVARYVSAEHVHRLAIESPNRKLAYRRLTKLCTQGSRPGDAPYLRRLEFRRAEGTAVPVEGEELAVGGPPATLPFPESVAASEIHKAGQKGTGKWTVISSADRQRLAVATLCRAGNQVVWRRYEGAGHSDTLPRSFDDAERFARAVFTGEIVTPEGCSLATE